MRGDAVVALVVTEAEGEVGIDRVEALVLQPVGPELVEQADAAPFLAQVQDHARLQLADVAQGRGQLVTAIAAQRAQRVTGEALAVEADRHVLLAEGVALDDGHVVLAVAVVPEADDVEEAELGGQVGDGGDPDADVVAPDAVAFVAGCGGDELIVGKVPEPRLLMYVHPLNVCQIG